SRKKRVEAGEAFAQPDLFLIRPDQTRQRRLKITHERDHEQQRDQQPLPAIAGVERVDPPGVKSVIDLFGRRWRGDLRHAVEWRGLQLLGPIPEGIVIRAKSQRDSSEFAALFMAN